MDNETIALKLFYSWINPKQRTGVREKSWERHVQKASMVGFFSFLFFLLSSLYDEDLGAHSQSTTSARQDPSFWDASAISGEKGQSQHLWRPFHVFPWDVSHCRPLWTEEWCWGRCLPWSQPPLVGRVWPAAPQEWGWALLRQPHEIGAKPFTGA